MGDSQFGQLGDGTTTTTATPRGVSPSRGEVVDQFAAGIDAFYTLPNGPNGMVTAALTTSGKVYGAGYNFNGELGDGTFIDRSTPVAFGLPAGEKATQIAVSGSGIKALTATGRVFGSGRNENGQLGNGSTIPRQYDPETYARLSSGESTPVEFQQPVGHRAMTLFNRQIASRGYGSENPYPYTFVVSCPRKLSVGDRVFNDANGNGTQDPGEETMTGVKVRLYLSGSDTPLAEDVTDANGSWLFDGLDPGTYVVEIVLPAGFENTVTTGTSGDPTNSTSNDNNGVTSNGITVRSKPLVLALGTAPTGEISGRTTKSLDADAFQTVAFGVYRKPAQTETPASVITPPAPLVAPKTPQEAPARVAIESTRLGAAKTASERRVFPGHNVSFTIVAKNLGRHTAQGVKVCDRLPASLTLVRGGSQKERRLQLADGSVSVSVGQIAAKGTKSVTLVTKVASNQRKGIIINTAKVSAKNAPTVLASTSILVLGSSSEVAPAVTG